MTVFLKIRCKTKHVFNKKVVARFLLKSSGIPEKEDRGPKKRPTSLRTLREPCNCGPSDTSGLSMTFAPQETFFGFLVVAYYRLVIGINSQIKILVPEGLVFIL